MAGCVQAGVRIALLLTCILLALPASAARLRVVEAPDNQPLSADEQKWAELIRARLERWESEIPALARVFEPVEGPEVAQVTIGNRGGEDAFTPNAVTIEFDVGKLQANYGDAVRAENVERIDRFFRHEYTHLLQKAWLVTHPYRADTPLRAALLDIWLEGLGNYYSLSSKWSPGSEATQRALHELEPRFVARLAALACASSDRAAALTADLSMGRFDQKWGALPAALWLNAAQSPDALRAFVLRGPDGVWHLAEQHLGAVIPEIRRLDCGRE